MIDTSAPTHCANHPDVETSLRCKTCGKPICAKCAIRTPTGYSCKDCVRGQQKVFVTAEWYDYPLAFIMAGIGAFLTSLLVGLISLLFYGFFVLLVAPAAGIIVAEAARFVTRRHRSPWLFRAAVGGMIAGGIPMLFISGAAALLAFRAAGLSSLFALLPFIWQVVFLVMGVPSMYYRLSGTRLKV